jgi:hypothetical protein
MPPQGLLGAPMIRRGELRPEAAREPERLAAAPPGFTELSTSRPAERSCVGRGIKFAANILLCNDSGGHQLV